jgi:hypothetical protein
MALQLSSRRFTFGVECTNGVVVIDAYLLWASAFTASASLFPFVPFPDWTVFSLQSFI